MTLKDIRFSLVLTNLAVLACLLLFFPSSASADQACYSSCDLGADRLIIDDMDTCGAGAAADYPLDSEPMCLGYEKPACSPTFFWLCTDYTACVTLGDWFYYADGQCFFYETGTDVDIGAGGTAEDYLRNINQQVVSTNSYLKQIFNVSFFFFPLVVIFLFLILLLSVITIFIRRKF